MIRSLPFTAFSPLTANVPIAPPRREVPREIDPNEPPGQDAFNRMLVRQREEARLASRLREAAQASASDAASTTQDAADTGKDEAAAPAEAVRTANRTAAGQGGDAGKPAQIDPETPAGEARHGRQTQTPGSEAELLAKLFKTPPKGLPPKQAPIGPEGPEAPPEEYPAGLPAGAAPGSSKHRPAPPDVECPVEPTMLALATSTVAAARVDSTQALQNRDAGDATVLPGRAELPAGTDTGAGTGAGPGTGGSDAGAGAAPSADAAAASDALAVPAPVSTPGDAPVSTAPEAGAAPGTLPASALAGPQQQPQAGAATPRQASLDARPGTEAFQMKFSAQVAVWVREGVHEAQLQLNPADLGPVRVAILLEGAAAQINFSAEHALTRQALEQALPTLAGSLAEAGFTLAGGGVFDQPRQPERSAADDSRRGADTRASGAASDADTPERSAVARPRGVVDLVA